MSYFILPRTFLVLQRAIWFCREQFVIVVIVVGHRTFIVPATRTVVLAVEIKIRRLSATGSCPYLIYIHEFYPALSSNYQEGFSDRRKMADEVENFGGRKKNRIPFSCISHALYKCHSKFSRPTCLLQMLT